MLHDSEQCLGSNLEKEFKRERSKQFHFHCLGMQCEELDILDPPRKIGELALRRTNSKRRYFLHPS